ncbi:MAG TPA: DNA repair protein RecN [Candidatus Dormibacteraeota bacterium]|jgi:DNA repair protein RecN (Recombination protein N)|nr:DNA repair protein RecN [Candidatus Dormibacteraeota bacterium]
MAVAIEQAWQGCPDGEPSTGGLLRSLRVRDLVLVDEAEVRFGPGLNLLTGETGSGKTLIVDALGLALGAAGSVDQVRRGGRRALAEASFDTSDGERVLGREIGRRSVARLDGAMVGVRELAEEARRRVSIHGQHDQHTLLDPVTQAALLDRHAGAVDVQRRVAEAHAGWTAAEERLQGLRRLQARGDRETAYLRWQLEEICAADPQPGEDESLRQERSAVRHAARLSELSEAALSGLRDDGIAAAAGSVRQAAGLDARLEELAARLEALEEEAVEAAADLRRYAELIDSDPERLERIESRLATLEQLQRKYGGSLESVLEERHKLEIQLGEAEDVSAGLEGAERAVEEARRGLERAAAALTRLRRKGATDLGRAVSSELRGLRLEEARFEVGLLPRLEIAANGAEEIEMCFSANPGEPCAALARVASGGELSRVMLAIETVAARSNHTPTLVFDEVDTGIGGETAFEVGRRLKTLGDSHQVLVVTHLAQIACFADHHLVVEKAMGADGRRVVRVRELTTLDERAAELARMMSGPVTEKALARARELMEQAGR